MFPGGNLSASQDGEIPASTDSKRHVDGPAYRMGAIRECFEESGILLARRKGSNDLLDVEESVREKARKDIHAGKLKFRDWVEEIGGIADTGPQILFFKYEPFLTKSRVISTLYSLDNTHQHPQTLHDSNVHLFSTPNSYITHNTPTL